MISAKMIGGSLLIASAAVTSFIALSHQNTTNTSTSLYTPENNSRVVLTHNISNVDDANANKVIEGTPFAYDGKINRAGVKRMPLPEFVQSGLSFLIKAQSNDGGWGAGSHARQDIMDPHAVQNDPATTAFTCLALIRSGNTLTEGPYHTNLSKALDYIVKTVEESPEKTPNITTLTGTQIQVKLGANIDVAMTSQFLTRILTIMDQTDSRYTKVKAAQDKCLNKIQNAQTANGSWNDGTGWAPVLQSTMANNALEVARENGTFEVKDEVLNKSRDYQQKNVAGDGTVATDAAAGVSLYAVSGSNRANAQVVSEAKGYLVKAKQEGKIKDDKEVTEDNLVKAGVSRPEATRMVEAQKSYNASTTILNDDRVLTGFGNNGGEEFLSFMMTSESKVIAGGEDWEKWKEKMSTTVKSIQNGDGSWNGHHCITSPVFCTAAVVMTMMVENDKEFLSKAKTK